MKEKKHSRPANWPPSFRANPDGSDKKPDATPSKEAKHTAGPKERKWKLLQMPDGGTLADIHGNVIAEIFNHDDAEFIFHAPELAQEVEDLRGDRKHLRAQRRIDAEYIQSSDRNAIKLAQEIDQLRERNRVLTETLEHAKNVIKDWHDMGNPNPEQPICEGATLWEMYMEDAPEMKKITAALSRNESKPSVSGGTNDKEI